MDLSKISKINSIIQQWLSDKRMMTVTSKMIFPKLVEEGLYDDSEDQFNTFLKEIRQLPKKQRHELLNVRSIGVEIGFQSR